MLLAYGVSRAKPLTIHSARRQLAFDIWWLAFALWLICIIEVSPDEIASGKSRS
jgi:hypothetical protein